MQLFCGREQWRRLLVGNWPTTEITARFLRDVSSGCYDDGTCDWGLKHNVSLTPESLLGWANSGSRLPVLLTLREFCDTGEWYRLLGEEWSGCDNVGTFRGRLTAIFKSDDWLHVERMMNGEERAARDALPANITAYRGCYERNQRGLSYSLDRDVATAFPYLTRYRSGVSRSS